MSGGGGSIAGSVLTELVPLALVIALSPLTVIPAILVLFTPAPRPTGLAYLAGWVGGLVVLTAVFVGLSGLGGGRDQPPMWASALRIVVGAALIAFGVYRWARRNRAAHTPTWMTSLTTVRPLRAAGTGAALTVVNPKVLFICAAAGLAIGADGLRPAGTVAAVAWFAVTAGSTVAMPILAYAVAGRRLAAPLTRLRDWLERRHAVLVAAILVIIGILVLYKGLHGI